MTVEFSGGRVGAIPLPIEEMGVWSNVFAEGVWLVAMRRKQSKILP